MHHDQPEDARFDTALDAWVLSRHADVSAALRAPELSVLGGTGTNTNRADTSARAAAREWLTSERLADWRTKAADVAGVLAANLGNGAPTDLFADFAAPWSLALAAAAIGVSIADAEPLDLLARQVFASAALSTSGGSDEPGRAAASELAGRLARTRASGILDVQSFVALSQTLPHFLASAWLTLSQQPHAMALLRDRPDLMAGAVEELLRLVGPSRAVFRCVSADVAIGTTPMSAGNRVVLLLGAANRDPARFRDPSHLDLARDTSGHLGFGRGTHGCVGASVIRMAAAVATDALLEATTAFEPIGTVRWLDGFAIRAVASLPVSVQRA